MSLRNTIATVALAASSLVALTPAGASAAEYGGYVQSYQVTHSEVLDISEVQVRQQPNNGNRMQTAIGGGMGAIVGAAIGNALGGKFGNGAGNQVARTVLGAVGVAAGTYGGAQAAEKIMGNGESITTKTQYVVGDDKHEMVIVQDDASVSCHVGDDATIAQTQKGPQVIRCSPSRPRR